MLTGGLASSLLGIPRYTQDIDLVVDLVLENLTPVLNAFPEPDFYVDATAAKVATQTKDMFQLIEVNTGDRVDFHLLTSEPFDQSRFGRRQTIDFMGQPLVISTAEDLIIQKLKWAHMSGGSQKQLYDASVVYQVQRDRLNREYLVPWIQRLGLTQFWGQLEAEAG